MSSKELLGTLEEMGVTGRSASSSVPEDMVPRLRASGGKATTKPKRREVLEPPTSPKPKRRKAAPKPAPAAVPAEPAAPTLTAVPDVAPSPPATPAGPSLPVMRFIRGATPQTIAEKTGRSPLIRWVIFTGQGYGRRRAGPPGHRYPRHMPARTLPRPRRRL